METSAKPHFVLVPWIGSISHIVPITDIGCLLASHGASVVIITTPANAPLVQYCRREDAPRRPSCIIAGMCNTWTLPVARDLGVPCYIFHGFGAFALLCIDHLYRQGRHEAIASAEELVDISVLQQFECKILGRQLPPHFLPSTSMGGGLMQEVREFDVAVDGVVVNSFDELEHGSAALLAAAAGKKVLAVGPVSLCCAPSLEPQGDDARRCMAWLDGKKANSVVYVSFGSAGSLPPAQLVQLGMALVSCRWPVMWVIRGADSLPDDVKAWLGENTDPDGVEDSKCLVVRGWAPQVAILAHPAVGGFMTHCGWGSTLESVAAGVPMLTWPLFAEQFVNEKLIVDVLAIGVSVGVTKPTENVLTASKLGGGEAKAEVGAERVEKALERLMDGAGEGEDIRRRAAELKRKANAALEKGGSSYNNLENLIDSCA